MLLTYKFYMFDDICSWVICGFRLLICEWNLNKRNSAKTWSNILAGLLFFLFSFLHSSCIPFFSIMLPMPYLGSDWSGRCNSKPFSSSGFIDVQWGCHLAPKPQQAAHKRPKKTRKYYKSFLERISRISGSIFIIQRQTNAYWPC